VAETIDFGIEDTTAEWWKLYVNEAEVACGLIDDVPRYEKSIAASGYEVELSDFGGTRAQRQTPLDPGYELRAVDGLGNCIRLRLM
jgi:hypothetical protein